MSIIKVNPIQLDEIDRQAAEVAAMSGDVIMKWEVGENVVRVLPATGDEVSPFRVTGLHYIKNLPSAPDKTIVFACPRVDRRTHGSPCPVCAKINELIRTGRPADKNRAKDIAVKTRVFANAWSYLESRNVIIAFGPKIWAPIKGILKNNRLGGDFTRTGPEGRDLIVIRTGTGPTDTDYSTTVDVEARPLAATEDEIQAILAGKHDLEAQVDTTIPDAIMHAFASREANPLAGIQRAQAIGGQTFGSPAVGGRFARPGSQAAVVETQIINAAAVTTFSDEDL